MHTTFISTLRHNVGDDFVREGLIQVLTDTWQRVPHRVSTIHKHAPISARHGFEWVRRKELSALLDWLPLGMSRDRILECDLLIQSGAPVYWCHAEHRCSSNEWYGPLIRRRHGRIRDRVPFLNLAAGSCQPYASDGSELRADPQVVDYICELHESAAVTTVRDQLSLQILKSLGLDAPVIPCASIFAREALDVAPAEPDYVALNFMPLGGHYDLAQNVRRNRWQAAFESFYEVARRRARCVFVCHDRREVKAVRAIDPQAEIFFSRDYRDYVRFYARARTGIVNRVHAAFMIASFGRPAFVIGNDSRSKMAEEIGLRHAYVDDVDVDRLVSELDRNLSDESYAARFSALKEQAREAYRKVLSTVEVASA